MYTSSMEEQDVGTTNISGAYMQDDMEVIMYIELEGAMSNLWVKLDPKLYTKYLHKVNIKSVFFNI